MTQINEAIQALQRNALFQGLSKEKLAWFQDTMIISEYPAGEAIINEGEYKSSQHNGIYVIISGHVEVLKDTPDGDDLVVATLYENDNFGEMTLFATSPRSATVKAIVPTKVLFIQIDSLDELKAQDLEIYAELSRNLAIMFNQRLRKTSELSAVAALGKVEKRGETHTEPAADSEEAVAKHMAPAYNISLMAAAIIPITLFSFCFYIFSDSLGHQLRQIYYYEIALSILFIFYIGLVKLYEQSFRTLGFTTRKISKSFAETLVLTGVIFVYMYIVKSVFGNILLSGQEAISLQMILHEHLWVVFVLVISAVVYELVVRGIFLTNLTNPNNQTKKWMAIIATSLLFPMIYYYGSIALIVLMIIPNLIWGRMYLHHHNIYMVMLSHVATNFWIIYLFGFTLIL